MKDLFKLVFGHKCWHLLLAVSNCTEIRQEAQLRSENSCGSVSDWIFSSHHILWASSCVFLCLPLILMLMQTWEFWLSWSVIPSFLSVVVRPNYKVRRWKGSQFSRVTGFHKIPRINVKDHFVVLWIHHCIHTFYYSMLHEDSYCFAQF